MNAQVGANVMLHLNSSSIYIHFYDLRFLDFFVFQKVAQVYSWTSCSGNILQDIHWTCFDRAPKPRLCEWKYSADPRVGIDAAWDIKHCFKLQ